MGSFGGTDYLRTGPHSLKKTILYDEDGNVLGGGPFSPLHVDVGDGNTVRLVDVAGNPLTITSGVLSVSADTELPAARTAADNLAYPTAPDVLAVLMGNDGATLDMLRTGSAMADGSSSGLLGVALAAWNGSTHDRVRGNNEGTVIASAAYTATQNSSTQTNYNARGVKLFISATAIAATPSVVFTVTARDPIDTATWVTLLTSAAITGISETVLTIYPGITAAANVSVSDILPRVWRVTATHGDADSITYSVGYSYVL